MLSALAVVLLATPLATPDKPSIKLLASTLLKAEDFKSIESKISELMRPPLTEDPSFDLGSFVRELGKSEDFVRLERWSKAYPRSSSPWASQAWAWIFRLPTAKDQKERMSLLSRAMAAGDKAMALGPSNPAAWEVGLLLCVETNLGDAVLEDRFAEMTRVDPKNWRAWFLYSLWREPLRHGDPLGMEMRQIVDQAGRLGGAGSRLGLLLKNFHQSMWSFGGNKADYFKKPGVWEEIRGPWSAHLHKHPEDIQARNTLAYYALLAGDLSASLEQFQAIGDAWEEDPWKTKDRFKKGRQEAEGRRKAGSLAREVESGSKSFNPKSHLPHPKGSPTPAPPKKELPDLAMTEERIHLLLDPQSGADRFSRLSAIYGDMDEAGHLERLRAWVTQKPDFAPAWTALASAWIAYAWEARGSGWGRDVTEEAWHLYYQRLSEAVVATDKAMRLSPSDPTPFVVGMRLCRAMGLGEPLMEARFQEAVKRDRFNYAAHAEKATFLSPKWYSDRAGHTMRQFLAEASAAAGPESRINLLISELHRDLWMMNGRQSDYFKKPGVWPELEKYFLPYLRERPQDLDARNDLAFLAVMAGKYDAANAQFDQIGKNWSSSIWGSEAVFLRAKREAMGLLPGRELAKLHNEAEVANSKPKDAEEADSESPGELAEEPIEEDLKPASVKTGVVPIFLPGLHRPPQRYLEAPDAPMREVLRHADVSFSSGLVTNMRFSLIEPYRTLHDHLKKRLGSKEGPGDFNDLEGIPEIVEILPLISIYRFSLDISTGKKSGADPAEYQFRAWAVRNGREEAVKPRVSVRWRSPTAEKHVSTTYGASGVKGAPPAPMQTVSYSNHADILLPLKCDPAVTSIKLAFYKDGVRKDAVFDLRYGVLPEVSQERTSTREKANKFTWPSTPTPAPTKTPRPSAKEPSET